MSSDLREKIVLDWNNVPIGTIRDAQMDPKTKTVRSLVVNLNSDAQSKLGAGKDVVIPIQYVFGIRRGEITLDRSLGEISRMGAALGGPSGPSLPPMA